MAGIPQPFSYTRTNPRPIEDSLVFDNMTAFTDYLASGLAYAGQICSVFDGGNEANCYKINADMSYTAVGTGAGGGNLSGDGSISRVVSVSWSTYKNLQDAGQLNAATQYNVTDDPVDGTGGGTTVLPGVVHVIWTTQFGSDYVTFHHSGMELEREMNGTMTRPAYFRGYYVKFAGVLNSIGVTTLDALTYFNLIEDAMEQISTLYGARNQFLDALFELTKYCQLNPNAVLNRANPASHPALRNELELFNEILEALMIMSPEVIYAARYMDTNTSISYEPLYNRTIKGMTESYIINPYYTVTS